MPNTPVLKFGVAGVGVMGRNHARVAAEMREFDLTTVFDPDAVVAEGVAGTATNPGSSWLLLAGVRRVGKRKKIHVSFL